jgi:hypothetical protein
LISKELPVVAECTVVFEFPKGHQILFIGRRSMMLFPFAPCMQHPCVIIPPGRSTDADIIRLSIWVYLFCHSNSLQKRRSLCVHRSELLARSVR